MASQSEVSTAVPSGAASAPPYGPAKLYYILVVLTFIYCFAFVDRQILNMLVTSIKSDLGYSDLAISYLLGPAFILTYVGCGLPSGWCADRFNRRNIIFVAGIVWSLGTMAAAFADSYEALFASRLIVGASEAFLFPAALSLIPDLFDRKRLPFATSIFTIAPSLGGGLALVGGGLILAAVQSPAAHSLPVLGDMRDWQGTLLIIGLIGLVPVLLMPTFRDRTRDRKGAPEPVSGERFSFRQGTLYMLLRWRFYVLFFLASSCSSLVMLTVAAWAPTFLTRTFGMAPAQVGTSYGTLVLIFGLGGTICGPIVNAWIGRWREDSPMQTVRLGPIFLLVGAVSLLLSKSQMTSLAALSLISFGCTFPFGMGNTALQLVSPPRLRGIASAYFFVTVSLISYGVGPTLVPLLAQYVLNDQNRLGEALAMVSILFGALAFILHSLALAGFRREFAGQEASLRDEAELPQSK